MSTTPSWHERLLGGFRNLGCGLLGGEDDGELVAGNARDRVERPHDAGDAARDRE